MTKGMIAKIVALKKQQDFVDEVDEQYKVERIALEVKYNAMKAVHYDNSLKIISGELVPEPITDG